MNALDVLGMVLVTSGFAAVAQRCATRRRLTLQPILTAPEGVALAAVLASAGTYASGAIALAGLALDAVTDARTGYMFDPVTRIAAGSSLLVAAFEGRLLPCLAGAVVCSGALMAIHVLTRGEGLGLGDVKAGGLVGTVAGVGGGLSALGTAFVIGAVYGVGIVVGRRNRLRDQVRFGPFLAAGTLLVLAYQRLNDGFAR